MNKKEIVYIISAIDSANSSAIIMNLKLLKQFLVVSNKERRCLRKHGGRDEED